MIALAIFLKMRGDLNGHVGRDRNGFEDVMGIDGYGERNADGEIIGTKSLIKARIKRCRLITYWPEKMKK